MLSTQRWRPDTCGCGFNEAFDDGLPDDVLPGTEVSRDIDVGHHEASFVSRIEGEEIKERRRQRIREVTERVKADWKAGRITVEDAYDAMHTRNSLERGLRAFDEDEIRIAREHGQEPSTYWSKVRSRRRQELYDFLYGRGPAKPSCGITDDPIEPNVLCARHEELSPREAHVAVRAENQRKNLEGIWPGQVHREAEAIAIEAA